MHAKTNFVCTYQFGEIKILHQRYVCLPKRLVRVNFVGFIDFRTKRIIKK